MEKQILITVCQRPKTQILVSQKLNKKQKEAKRQRFLDEHGKLRIDTVGEYDAIHSKY